MSGIRPSSRGSVHVSLVSAIRFVRAWASAKRPFCWSSLAPPAPAQSVYCETHSTPAEMKMSPSPALMAWKAIRVVWAEEAQKRLIVAAGVASRSSRVATTLAMLEPCRPEGSAQPR